MSDQKLGNAYNKAMEEIVALEAENERLRGHLAAFRAECDTIHAADKAANKLFGRFPGEVTPTPERHLRRWINWAHGKVAVFSPPDAATGGNIALMAADALAAKDAEIERLRARVADLEEQCLRALGERLERKP